VIACVDVDYRDDGATTACVGFDAWTDGVARIEIVMRSNEPPAEYQPGAFYERELPYLIGVLERMPPVEIVIVDGYVWLGPDRPGLGWHVHDLLGVTVVGVAKTKFEGSEPVPILRFGRRYLYITSIGIPVDEAAEHVRTMHGEYRMPTLLTLADGLARGNR
jgi:deoxyribonuclease V